MELPRQLLAIRLAEATHEQMRETDLFREEFLLSRPLLTALDHPGPRPAVLLIDEVDRADDEFEAFLFEMLAESSVTIPELGTRRAVVPPVVILTSNRTRDLHDALKRRCLYHWIGFPDAARVAAIIRRRVPAAGEALAGEVAAAVARLRALELTKSPGISEAITWARALAVLGAPTLSADAADATMSVVSSTRRTSRRCGRPGWRLSSGMADGPPLPQDRSTRRWRPSLAVALRSAGLPAGPDRSGRLAGALTVMRATTLAELHACALATMVSGPAQVDAFERVFSELFGAGRAGRPAAARGDRAAAEHGGRLGGTGGRVRRGIGPVGGRAPTSCRRSCAGSTRRWRGRRRPRPRPTRIPKPTPRRGLAVRRVASMTERLRQRDFAQLSPSELAQLATLMRQLVIAVPPRRTRRYRPRKDGARLDMRRTMRQAIRTGGEPIAIARQAVRVRQRRLVVLCDISGSMEPYARAILQLMYVASRSAGASGGGGSGFSGPTRDAARPRTEVFTFATRLTRLTPYLAAATPESMLARAGQAAPDWAGGTRIGAALREFNDRYGTRGMARGAVVLIISDGWETGDPALVGAQMARLHRVAYRIVWANPRTQSDRYRPEVGGMAAAWPYCDAVVSAHNFESLDELLAALRAPRARHTSPAIARSTVMIADAISETGPAASVSFESSLTDAGDVGAVLAHLGGGLLGRRLRARLIGQLGGVVADGRQQVAHKAGQLRPLRAGSGSAAGWLTTCDARAPGPWASAPMCTVPPLMTMPLGSGGCVTVIPALSQERLRPFGEFRHARPRLLADRDAAGLELSAGDQRPLLRIIDRCSWNWDVSML